MATGFLYDPIFLKHDPGHGHPETAKRLTCTLEHLQKQHWFSELSAYDSSPIEMDWLFTTHEAEYVARARLASHKGHAYLDTSDVGINQNSFDAALHAAGGALKLADKMMAKEIQNGFGLLRPPGHHAENSFAMGFCLFNNVAILARYLQKKYGLEKICILDWDVHHGNGTQHTFETDASVLYISLHQYPFYPGTGSAQETGVGKGAGATLNCPMASGASKRDYEDAFRLKILPKLDDFKPDAVLISAGFDAHFADPLGSINLDTGFFGWMTERLLEVASKYSEARLLSLLEGGYNLDYLPECVSLHVESLMRGTSCKK